MVWQRHHLQIEDGASAGPASLAAIEWPQPQLVERKYAAVKFKELMLHDRGMYTSEVSHRGSPSNQFHSETPLLKKIQLSSR